MRSYLKSPLRLLFVLGLCLLVPLVFAVGLAWACGPASYTTVQPSSGAAASDAIVKGSGFPPGRVEIRWDKPDAPVLTTAQGPDFSTHVTIPNTTPGPHYLVAVARLDDGSVAYQSAVAFQVTAPPSVALQPASGPNGTTTTATGRSFGTGPVEIHWDTTAGALLQTAAGPNFSTSVTIPDSAPGDHSIVALSRDSGGNQAGLASAPFNVAAPAVAPAAPAGNVIPTLQAAPVSSPPPPPDTDGPVNAETELTRQNGTRTVSRKGEVRVFCGRYTEAGVTGSCGASSARPLAQTTTGGRGKSARSIFLRLGARDFEAEAGRPVLLKFILNKSSMKMLMATKQVRMRGSVRARDASGNLTRASFGLTLKPPAPRSR